MQKFGSGGGAAVRVVSFAPTTLELLVLEMLDSGLSLTVKELADKADILKSNSIYKILSRLARNGTVCKSDQSKPARYSITRLGKIFLSRRRLVVAGKRATSCNTTALYRVPMLISLPKTLSGTERLCLELLGSSKKPQSRRWVIEQAKSWLKEESAGTTLRRLAHRGYLNVWRARHDLKNMNLYTVSDAGWDRLQSVKGSLK